MFCRLAYASSIRLSSRGVSLSLAMLNASGLIGRLALGVLSDVMDPWFLACSTLSLCAFSVFVLWGTLSYTLAGLLSFAVMYGCLAGGWTSLWSRFIRPIASGCFITMR
jgi:MCP family monocarboxylic acid transporter-like MFS transporter 10